MKKFELEINHELLQISNQIKYICSSIDPRELDMSSDLLRDELSELIDPIIIKSDSQYEVNQIKWMSGEYCQYLSKFGEDNNLLHNYHGDTRIVEIPFSQYDEYINNILRRKFETELKWIIRALYNSNIQNTLSIHYQYTTKELMDYSSWHIDHDSDITLTVPLNDEYIGQHQMEISGRGYRSQSKVIDYIDIGVVNIFPGRSRLHRSLPVEGGDKRLLIFWTGV